MSDGKAAELDVIRGLNAQMHAEEKRGADGLGFYRELLDQTLRFRRANGAVVTRNEYLIDLANPANRREQIEPDGPIDCTVYENTAIASVKLRVKGSNAGAPFAGLFRNVRIFHREAPDKPWRLKVWFNDKVPDPNSKS
jgi:Domain of unknown function (DUF4440)